MEMLISIICVVVIIYFSNKHKKIKTQQLAEQNQKQAQAIADQFRPPPKKPVKQHKSSSLQPPQSQSLPHTHSENSQHGTTNIDDDLTEFEFTINEQQVASQQPISQFLEEDDFDDEDDLSAFEISHSHNESVKTKNTVQGVFMLPADSVQIGEHTINGGLFYFGGWLPKIQSEFSYFNVPTEASLVDHMLPIEDAPIDYEDESLSYWPQFNSISASCRGAYIAWLASDRDHPQTPIGYVFIFFYGLERRVLVDFTKGMVSDDEFRLIYDQVSRLRQVYQHSRSFNGYAARLMESMAILAPHLIPITEDNIDGDERSLTFKYYLANIVDSGVAISPQLAYLWLKAHSGYCFRTPARRCAVEFKQLFMLMYQDKYVNLAKDKQGLMVKPNKTRLVLSYRPASGSLEGIQFTGFDLPDPSVLSGPINKFITIAEKCTEQLEAYSRYLGRAGNSRDDIAGLLFLPDELFSIESSTRLQKFRSWVDEVIEQHHGLVSVSDFWHNIDVPAPEKINKKEIELLTNLCQRVQVGFAPDPRYHQVKPTPDGKLVLFAGGHGEYFEPSSNFFDVAIIMRLGAMMARADEHINDDEVTLLQRLIEHDTKLSPSEKTSLHAYLLWRLNTPVNMAGLKAKLTQVGDNEKQALSHILVSIALADGTVDPSEIKQLEKLYTALGLDKALVSSDIHQVSTSRQPITNQSDLSSSAFNLDHDLVSIHQAETAQVQSILGAIFADNQLEEDQEDETPLAASQQSSQYPGLAINHQDLLDTLLNQDHWTRAQVQDMCDTAGLMVDGAIEVINDWAFDQIDEAIIENDGDITIDREIADELIEQLAGVL